MNPVVRRLSERERGAIFTPPTLAWALAEWAIRLPTDRVLDPSAGDGELLGAAVARLRALGAVPGSEHVVGIEVHRRTAKLAQARLGRLSSGGKVHHVDAFHLNGLQLKPVDALLMNPPWVRYQLLNGERRERALAAACLQGVLLGGRSSLWAPYLVHAVSFLKRNGRLAAVVPAELLHADYAEPVRAFLCRHFRSVRVFALEEQIFSAAEVTPLVIFADQEQKGGFRVTRIRNLEALGNTQVHRLKPQPIACRRWTSLLAQPSLVQQVGELSTHDSVAMLGDIADVDLGVVTGADRFFLMTPRDAVARGIPRANRIRAIATLRYVHGLEIDHDDWLRLGRAGRAAWIFSCNEGFGSIRNRRVTAYIKDGEANGSHTSFKCRIRNPWYSLRMPTPPDGFLTYMAGTLHRLVLNPAKLIATNLAHRVMFRPGTLSPRIAAASFLSTLTQASIEIEGRTYGGGVIKLELGDARRLIIVVPTGKYAERLAAAYPQIDMLVRNGLIEEAVEVVDEIILGGQLGLGPKHINALRQRVIHLRTRRTAQTHRIAHR